MIFGSIGLKSTPPAGPPAPPEGALAGFGVTLK